jgi:hypothetical protein
VSETPDETPDETPELSDDCADQFERRRQAHLEGYRRAWERKENPFYVWEALDYCPGDRPLPPWMMAYFKGCRERIGRLAFPKPGEPPPNLDDVATLVAIAMGFTRKPNFNALRRRREDNDAANITLMVKLFMTGGLKPHAAVAKVANKARQRMGKNQEPKRMSRKQVHNRIKAAKKLWEK